MWTFAGLCSHGGNGGLLRPASARVFPGAKCADELGHGGWFHELAGRRSICSLPDRIQRGSIGPQDSSDCHHRSILLRECDSHTPVPRNNPFILTQIPPSGGNIELFLRRAAVEERRNHSLPFRFDLLMEFVFTCAVYGVSQRSMSAPVSA